MTSKLSKPVRVAPDVTDPTMRSTRGPGETLLQEEHDETLPDDMKDIVFDSSTKTKEEAETPDTSSNQVTSTIMIYAFVLIVIALIAIIVWLVMKQNTEPKAPDMKQLLAPNQPSMPNLPRVEAPVPPPAPVRTPQQQLNTQNAAQYNALRDIQRQQLALQRDLSAEPVTSTEETHLSDVEEEEDAAPTTFTLDEPHPSIIRPGDPPASDEADIISQMTEAKIKEIKDRST